MTAPALGQDEKVVAVPQRNRHHCRWLTFIVRRTIRMAVSMLVILTAAFLVLRLSGGDPVRTALGVTADESVVQARRDQLGLNDPLFVQFVNYVGGLFRGDLGVSLITGRSVSELVANRLLPTVELSLLALVVVIVLAVPLGLLVGIATQSLSRRKTEVAFTSITGFIAGIPDYLLGVMLVIVFAIGLHALPVAGQSGPASYILPVLALSLSSAASLARIARIEALNTLGDDYIRTAKSKRLPLATVYFRHALPNMLTAVLTIGGTLLSTMIASSVLVEQVFNWPGMGTAFSTAIVSKDYGIVQGLALVYAAIILVVNLAVDILIAAIDRRTTLLETA